MSEYITIKQAQQLARRSDSAIRRILRNMDEATKSANVQTDGKRILIKRSYIVKHFKLSVDAYAPPKRTGKATTGETYAIQALTKQMDKQSAQIERLQNQNDYLLKELHNKDDDLKGALSLVHRLQDENKTLQAAPQAEPSQAEPSALVQNIAYIAVTIAALSFVLYMFFT